MNHCLRVIVLAVFLGALGECLRVSSSQKFFTSRTRDVTLTCGGSEDQYSNNTIVQFWSNGQLMFDSALAGTERGDFPFLKSRLNSRSILLNHQIIPSGFSNVFCRVNNTRSNNTLTIPYIMGPIMRYSPTRPLAVNQTQRITCDGYLQPSVPTTYEFTQNGQVFASILNGRLNATATNMKVTLDNSQRNTIVIVPSELPQSGSVIACALRFNIPDSIIKSVVSNKWRIVH